MSEWSRGGTTELDAAGAVNGIVTGTFQFHTSEELNAWWCVDLVEINEVASVKIFNRSEAESLAARLLPFSVLISIDGMSWVEVYWQADGPPPGTGDDKPLVIELSSPAPARFVKVQKQGHGYLHLDQVEVYSRRDAAASHHPSAVANLPAQES
jgi:hypothetical protein